MAYSYSGLEKIIENPFVRKSIERSKRVIFFPTLAFVLIIGIVSVVLLHEIIKDLRLLVTVSAIIGIILGYRFYTFLLLTWIKKELSKDFEYKREWINKVKEYYFSRAIIPKNSFLKKADSLLTQGEKDFSEASSNITKLDLPDILIIKKSKKRAVIIIIFACIILLLFTNQYLYLVFSEELMTGTIGSYQKVWNLMEFLIGGMVITIFYQMMNLFRRREVLKISEKGILYDGFLYTWDTIKDDEVSLGKKSRGIISHYLIFNHQDEKISIKIDSLNRSPEDIASALWYYRKKSIIQD